MALKAVVFDLDGTLVDQESAERDALKALYDTDIELPSQPGFHAFLRAWRNIADEHLQKFLDNKVGFDEQRVARFMDIYPHFGQAISQEKASQLHRRYMEHYRGQWRPYPDAGPMLEALKGKCRLAVITNGDPVQQRAKLDKTGLTPYFEQVLVSGDIKIAKPLPGIFEHLAKLMGLAASELAYVGDRLEIDAHGSRDAGWTAVWLNRLKMPGGAGLEKILVIQDLESLPALLFPAP